MADVNRGNRPLSPHLTIYRPQITSITSILTRITGNAMLITGILIVWWFLAASSGPEYFAVANGVLTCWFGDLVMALSVLGLWYHTLAGLRHLVWDEVVAMDIKSAENFGWAILIGSVGLTIITLVAV